MFYEHNWKKIYICYLYRSLKQLLALLILIYLPEQCVYLFILFIASQVQFG